ncbi:MAG: TlpA disulfide reductase family protein [Saprospiraceae bacterium]
MKKFLHFLVFAVFSLTATRAQQRRWILHVYRHPRRHSQPTACTRSGFIVLLDFFFVNCPPCQGSAPELAAIANDYAGKSVILWSISDRDGNAAIEGFEETYGLNFPAGGTDGDGEKASKSYANNFNFTGFPTISIICPDGSISWDIWPYSTGAPEWRNAIDACGVVDSAPYVSLNNTRVENIATVAQATLSPNQLLPFLHRSPYPSMRLICYK